MSLGQDLQLEVKSLPNLETFLHDLGAGQSDCDPKSGLQKDSESVKSYNNCIIVPDRASFVSLSYWTFP